MRKYFLTALFIFLVLGCQGREESRGIYALGTFCNIRLFEDGRAEIYDAVFKRIYQIEKLMSVNIEESDIARINAKAGIEAVSVSEETFNVISRALFFARLSDGMFDPSIGPLVQLWAIGTEAERVPEQHEIDEALSLVNWNDVELSKDGHRVFLKRSAMSLDLGGIAKGYAADEAARIVKSYNVKRAVIDLGGNILVLGEKEDRSTWKIGIQDPLDSRGEYLGIIELAAGTKEKSIVTSGVYERSFEKEGVNYHHILSPATGRSAESGLLSVSIAADSSMDADALSTAVFVLGWERGRALLEKLGGVQGIFIFKDKRAAAAGEINFTLSKSGFDLYYN